MSANDDSGPGRREVAHRLFAAEFDDATVSYAESDEERAPKYVVTPTGARVNRLFAVGVLTEVESVNDDVLRARVVDPTGAFVSYAGQYQPDAAAFFERAAPPTFVALTGKARTFEPEDSDRVYTSVRPESVSEVDAETRDRWTVSAAEATLRRVAATTDALSMDERGDDLHAALLDRGYDESLASGIPIALDRYGTTVGYLDAVREVALDALELVAGDRDEVRSLDVAPDDVGTTSLGPLPEAVRRAPAADIDTPTADPATTESGTESPDAGAAASTVEGGDSASASEPASESASEPEPEPEPVSESASEPEPVSESASEPASESTAESGESAAAADPEPSASESVPESAAESELESEPEPEPEPEPATEQSTDELGDFDDGDLYELDEEERKEVEAEFDVGFESGAEVGDPGEADIDVPGPEDLEEEVGEVGESEAAVDTADETDEVGDLEEAADDDETAADVDLEAAAVDAMSDLDDGDGAPHDAVVAAVVDEYGADPGAVADAIDDALMSGKCYEPSEDRLKAI